MTQNDILQILSGCVGSLGFGVLFNIRGMRLFAAAMGGLLSWTLFVLLDNFIVSEPVNYIIVSMLTSMYAEVMARVLKTPTTTFITTSLVPLIPGGSLYYTMAYAFESDLTKFLDKAISTLELAAALAMGIILSTTLTTIFFKILQKRKNALEKRVHP